MWRSIGRRLLESLAWKNTDDSGLYAGRVRMLRIAIGLSLAVSAGLFVVWTRHWPLVGDASTMHYMAWLIEQGKAPYRDFYEMSVPGSFLIELAAMKVFGMGAVGWRAFDLSLLAVAGGSFWVMTRRAGWFPAVFAGTLFALVHGRDGLMQGGQRDLTMAVALVASTALLAVAVRRGSAIAMAGFGLLAGVALTIKPTALPLSVAQLGIAVFVLRRRRPQERAMRLPLLWAGAGMAVAPLIAGIFLVREGAVGAFWRSLTGLVPYYAGLGHKPLGFLLGHSVSPVLALVLIWFAVVALARPRLDFERGLLVAGVVFGWLSYVVQARGLPYYRYPLLAFLLPLMALDFSEASGRLKDARVRVKAGAWLAGAGLCVGGLFLGPQSAVLVHRYRWWESDYLDSMQANLERLGGSGLSGQVQCVDSISGCVTVLYRMRLLPASGVLLDFPLFGDARKPFVEASREQFRAQVMERAPRVIVVTSPLYVDGPGDYKKLELWPELETFLEERYTRETDWRPWRTKRWWSREEYGPSYRIYVRRDAAIAGGRFSP